MPLFKFLGKFNKLQATLSAEYEITSAVHEEDVHTIGIKLLGNLTTNEMIRILLPMGDIIGFREIIPSMNDIFIQVVENTNSGNKLL